MEAVPAAIFSVHEPPGGRCIKKSADLLHDNAPCIIHGIESIEGARVGGEQTAQSLNGPRRRTCR